MEQFAASYLFFIVHFFLSFLLYRIKWLIFKMGGDLANFYWSKFNSQGTFNNNVDKIRWVVENSCLFKWTKGRYHFKCVRLSTRVGRRSKFGQIDSRSYWMTPLVFNEIFHFLLISPKTALEHEQSVKLCKNVHSKKCSKVWRFLLSTVSLESSIFSKLCHFFADVWFLVTKNPKSAKGVSWRC